MKFVRFTVLILIIAAAVWFLGKQIEALQNGTSNKGLYKEAINDAKSVAKSLSF